MFVTLALSILTWSSALCMHVLLVKLPSIYGSSSSIKTKYFSQIFSPGKFVIFCIMPSCSYEHTYQRGKESFEDISVVKRRKNGKGWLYFFDVGKMMTYLGILHGVCDKLWCNWWLSKVRQSTIKKGWPGDHRLPLPSLFWYHFAITVCSARLSRQDFPRTYFEDSSSYSLEKLLFSLSTLDKLLSTLLC